MGRNRLYTLPDLRGYKSMVYLDLSQNYISALPEQSLSMLVSGTVKLDANPIPCVQELCWLATSNLSVEVTVTCRGGLSWQEMDIDVLCEGMSQKTPICHGVNYIIPWDIITFGVISDYE